jgi:wobble nucleotide-excising tRNase
MMIEWISKIKNHRIFHNFTWGKDLNNFGKYNLIYGRNATGKSTLSNLFRAIEKRVIINEGEVEFVVSGEKKSNADLVVSAGAPLVRVFNKEFASENIFTSHGSVSPIFFLGEESIEKQKQIEDLKQLLVKSSVFEKEKCDEKARLEKAFEEFKSGRAKTIKNFLSSSGVNPYNNYDKRAFQGKCDKLLQLSELEVSQCILNDADRDMLKKEKEAVLRIKLHEVNLSYPNMNSIFEEVNLILQQSIVSSSLETLKNDPGLAEWVRTGHMRHKEKKSSDCHFCGQVLPVGCLEALESHFNNEYNAFITKINGMSAAIQLDIDRLSGFSLPNKFELYDHLVTEYEIKAFEFTNDLTAVISFLKILKLALMEKAKNPFQQVNPVPFESCGRADLLLSLNLVIRKHNEKTDGFQGTINDAKARLEQSLVAESLPEFKTRSSVIDQLSTAVVEMSAENASLSKQIYELEKDIGSHRKPADELNADICAYFGRQELTFETKENGYQIYRHGSLAQNLSEGEKTAIALLYFLKTLGDKSFSLEDGIVVIDDPIASLDSAALFRAFECIKERTKMVAQLFIMTHNHLFFRQVEDWFRDQNKADAKRSACFYMLRDNTDSTPRSSCLLMFDPLLNL